MTTYRSIKTIITIITYINAIQRITSVVLETKGAILKTESTKTKTRGDVIGTTSAIT